MTITFEPLGKYHFPLLLKWLEEPHVKAWWDQEVKWTLALIQEKYGSYTKGYKIENGAVKTIHAYIIHFFKEPIGYIQIYNAYDFPRTKPLLDLPENLAAFDIFIGEKHYLGKGLGSQALRTFLDNVLQNMYPYVFADPDIRNIAAIKAYERAGFRKIKEHLDIGEIWMLRSQSQ